MNFFPTFLTTSNPCLDFFFQIVSSTPASYLRQQLLLALRPSLCPCSLTQEDHVNTPTSPDDLQFAIDSATTQSEEELDSAPGAQSSNPIPLSSTQPPT